VKMIFLIMLMVSFNALSDAGYDPYLDRETDRIQDRMDRQLEEMRNNNTYMEILRQEERRLEMQRLNDNLERLNNRYYDYQYYNYR